MTTSAEERREQIEQVLSLVAASGLETVPLSVDLLEALIAQAITQAENDKLEEAERAVLNEHSMAESADLNTGILRAARAVKALRLSIITPEKD